MKFLAVCGFGVGSSLMLRMSIEKACKVLDLKASVSHADVSSAKGMECDAIFTSLSLYDSIKAFSKVPVYPITNFVNKAEIENAVRQFMLDNSI